MTEPTKSDVVINEQLCGITTKQFDPKKTTNFVSAEIDS
jgi:hypothetical protein